MRRDTQQPTPEITDPEILAMRDMARAFLRCPPEGRSRALGWLISWAQQHTPSEAADAR